MCMARTLATLLFLPSNKSLPRDTLPHQQEICSGDNRVLKKKQTQPELPEKNSIFNYRRSKHQLDEVTGSRMMCHITYMKWEQLKHMTCGRLIIKSKIGS